MNMKKKKLIKLAIALSLIAVVLFISYVYISPIYNKELINSIDVKSYDNKTKIIKLEIKFTKNHSYIYCKTNNSKIKIKNKKCTLELTEKDINDIYLTRGPIKRKISVENLVLNIEIPKKVYLAKGETYKLNPVIDTINSTAEIEYKSDNEKIISVSKNIVKANKTGTSSVSIYLNGKKQKSIEFEVTNLINKRTKKINNEKPYLPCNVYTEEEAKKLDEILENRIENVGGYKTRAAVVEAIRFLTLDLKYKIDYFFENGRITGGMHYADGEGRYYHKGLYLHDYKKKSIESSYAGPAIWGCPLKNFEDYPPKYRSNSYNNNGLDCSGFVSWAILNGGFDVGDKGAGDNLEDDTELNDVGDKVELTDELMKSGKVKAGDIVGIWGHIAIIAGIDSENAYVAESLWTYGGVVVNTYKLDELDEEFVQVTLMDKVYKKDGKYTNIWY